MITLKPITPFNYKQVTLLRASPTQSAFTPSATEILARAYAWRDMYSRALAICYNDGIVGVLLLSDGMNGYELKHLLIDVKHQRKGYGKKTVKHLLSRLRREKRSDSISVSVSRSNEAAMGLFKALGFREPGYGDPFKPEACVLVYTFPAG